MKVVQHKLLNMRKAVEDIPADEVLSIALIEEKLNEFGKYGWKTQQIFTQQLDNGVLVVVAALLVKDLEELG